MKKFIALLLAGLMLMSVACAETVAVEQSPAEFDITMVVPEGYTMMEDRYNDTLIVDIEPEDGEALPYYFMTIAFSEEYEGQSMSDLAEEDQEALVNKIADENFAQPTISSSSTQYGTLVYILDEEENEETDYALAYTLYKGYFIQMSISYDDYRTLTEDDIQRAMDLLSEMWFVDAAE